MCETIILLILLVYFGKNLSFEPKDVPKINYDLKSVFYRAFLTTPFSILLNREKA
jgi:hypothetical protein